jgi:triosephosphate isomerase
MGKKTIIANWKMNHCFDEANQWLEDFMNNYEEREDLQIILCPPVFVIEYFNEELDSLHLERVNEIVANKNIEIEDLSTEQLEEMTNQMVKLGAQDCHHEISGAFTGDISAKMLNDIGCKYVILGHSERRIHHHETSEIIAKKIQAASSQGLIPVLCVGENQEARENKRHLEFVYKQMMDSIPKNINFEELIIGYEPVWAIGTGKNATKLEIEEMAKLIRKILVEKIGKNVQKFSILYGGSTNPSNSREILSIPNIDGLLVGSASLDANEFLKIIKNS